MPESPSTPTEVNTNITFVKSANLENTDNTIIHAEAGDHNEDIMIVCGGTNEDGTTNNRDEGNICPNDGNEDHDNNDKESENEEIGDYIIVNGVIIPRLNLNFSDSEPGTPIKTPDWISLWSSSTSDYTGSSYTPFSTSSSDSHTDDHRSISSHSSDILPSRPHYHRYGNLRRVSWRKRVVESWRRLKKVFTCCTRSDEDSDVGEYRQVCHCGPKRFLERNLAQ